MIDQYHTVKSESFGDYRERGSKFLSTLFPCESEEHLKEKVNDLKQAHSSARHFCYGAIIGYPNSIEKSNDSGEPSGSAGAPILNQLLSAELVNVAIVVARHYGGTKLGKAGLINAYKESAQMAIENCTRISQYISDQFVVDYGYDDTSEIMRIVNGIPSVKIVEQTYLERCQIRFNVPKSLTSNALLLFNHLQDVTISLEES